MLDAMKINKEYLNNTKRRVANMLTNIENHSWIIILPVFGLLFMVIWNALKSSSIFPKPACFVIALCVSILCLISVIGFFPQVQGSSQEDASLQEPQQHRFHFILLPYMALTLSFLLLLIVTGIARFGDGRSNLFRPSYGKKKKITTTNRIKEKTGNQGQKWNCRQIIV